MFYFNLNHRVAGFLKSCMVFAYRCIGRKTISFDDSNKILKDFVVSHTSSGPVELMAIPSVNGKSSQYLSNDKVISFRPQIVWEANLKDRIKSIHVCRSGAVMLNNKLVLNLDFGGNAGLLNSPFSPLAGDENLLIAPWSHFWGRYYDFVITLLPKLCRIETIYGKEIWSKAKICYPLFNAPYEREFFEKLSIPLQSLIDTRKNKSFIKAERVVIANNNEFFYPAPSDIQLLKDRFLVKDGTSRQDKIFITRKNRRKILNETGVREVLEEFNFKVIEDQPRGIMEQIDIFQHASVIVGPHGAAFTNLIWCSPGTRVLEIFNSGYSPPYYYYLCKILQLEYHYLLDESELSEDKRNVGKDIMVNIELFREGLQKVLMK